MVWRHLQTTLEIMLLLLLCPASAASNDQSVKVFNLERRLAPKEEGKGGNKLKRSKPVKLSKKSKGMTTAPTAAPYFPKRCPIFSSTGDDLRVAVKDYYGQDEQRKSEVQQRYGENIGEWCVSGVQNFDNVFLNQESSIDDISKWDTSSATSMASMVRSAGKAFSLVNQFYLTSYTLC